MKVGDNVEWNMWGGGIGHGRVTRIDDDGTTHVMMTVTNSRGRRRTRNEDVYFGPREVHRLRVVP